MTVRPRSPRFDLQAAQAAAVVQIGTSCARRTAQTLSIDSIPAGRAFADALFRSLVPSDFAHCELMRKPDGSTRFGDVYGKRDDIAVWFIKIEFDGHTTTVLLSCHEAEHPLGLADGRTLRPR